MRFLEEKEIHFAAYSAVDTMATGVIHASCGRLRLLLCLRPIDYRVRCHPPPPMYCLLKVLDYTIQMHRLLPLLAETYAFHFTGRALTTRLRRLEEQHIHGTVPTP